MPQPYFPTIQPIPYEGPDTENPLAFRWYDADRVVLGKPMRDQLRIAICYWHTFCWPGVDMFGAETLRSSLVRRRRSPAARRPQGRGGVRALRQARCAVLHLPRPRRGARGRDAGGDQCRARPHPRPARSATWPRTGVQLLWGTANLFSHPRYAAGAATNPDPDVFAYAAAQVKKAMDATRRLGGANYVLWGGREGYDTLLNTDLRRERTQLGRFMQMVVEHKHAIGFHGTLLIEPKPMEPTKHQYDHDAAAVHGVPPAVRPRARDQAQHRGQPRHPGRPQLPARARLRDRQRSLRQRRRQPRRRAERLGHRSVPQQPRRAHPRALHHPAGRRAAPPAASTSTPSCAGRASSRTICSTPTSAASTRWRAACCAPAALVERGDVARFVARALRRLGR